MRRFWAIRRIDRDYVEPTLYKSEAAARSAAASRRGYDVLALFSEAEARSARVHAPDCQSHIVDVRGRPDPCTCGLEGGDHD